MTLPGLSPKPPPPERTASIVEADPLVGRVIAGKYQVLSRVGAGGMGAVYKAQQLALDKPVAVKVLHQALEIDAQFVARFHVEAKAASMFDHPSSTRVIDFGEEPDGLLYIVMEFLEGKSLLDVITHESPLAPSRIADLLRQALAALAVAHERGILHRDLKPENILVLPGRDDDGAAHDVVKVCDFGIAKLADAPVPSSLGGAITMRDGLIDLHKAPPASGPPTEPSAPPAAVAVTTTPSGIQITPAPPGTSPVGPPITRVGLIIGTPEYMSPEQARGEVVDARSDIYSMGCVLYHLVTGQPPFHGDTPLVTATLHATAYAKKPSELNPNVDPTLERVCLRAMQKEPDDRYANAREMRADLKPLVHAGATEPHVMPGAAESSARLQPIAADALASIAPEKPAPRRSGFVLGGVLLAIGVATGLWIFWPASTKTAGGETINAVDAGATVTSGSSSAPIASDSSPAASSAPPPPASASSIAPLPPPSAHPSPTPPGPSTPKAGASVVNIESEHVSKVDVRAAINMAKVKGCYANAVKGSTAGGTAVISLQMDNGKISSASVDDDFGLAGLKACIVRVVNGSKVGGKMDPGATAKVSVLFDVGSE